MGNSSQKNKLYLINHQADNPITNIQYLAFGCGSIRGMALISAYWTLFEIPGLKINIKGASGCSVGAIMCLALFLKLTQSEMMQFQANGLSKNFGQKLHLVKKCNRWSFWNENDLKEGLEHVMESKGVSKNTTFADLKNFDMRIVAYDITTSKEKVFSINTSPTTKILQAICASCAMPFIFSPTKIANKCYVDGGVKNEFPFQEFDIKHTLGFYLYDKYRNESISKPFFENINEEEKNHIVSIDVSKMSFLDLNPTKELLEWITNQGKQAVLQFYHRRIV